MRSPRRLWALVCFNLLLALLCAWLFSSRGVSLPGKPPERASLAAPATAPLHLHWSRQYPALTPAWPDDPRLQFDNAYEPAVLGNKLFVASSRHDCVTALDLDTGAELWRFFTEGPVRLTPTVWQDRVFAVADDGYLYCLSAADGSLVWKFRGGPNDRKVLGNGRLISMWPARGAPAVADNTVYFAAGIWPFMGIFLHALDTRTGAVVWTNSGDGSLFIEQPHYAEAFGGIAPQGYLAVAGDKLLVPNGRAAPACYDRRTGKLLHYRLAENSRRAGGADMAVSGSVFLSGGNLFDVDSGEQIAAVGEPALLSGNFACGYSAGALHVYDLAGLPPRNTEMTDRRGRRTTRWSSYDLPRVAATPLLFADALARDNARLYVGAPDTVLALDGKANAVWRADIDGKPASLVTAQGRLLVSTRGGRIYCFGPTPREPVHHRHRPTAHEADKEAVAHATELLHAADVHAGYGVAYGAGNGELLQEVVRQSHLNVVVVEPDAAKVANLRRELTAADVPAERLSFVSSDWRSAELPPYLASVLVVPPPAHAGGSLTSSDQEQAQFVHKAYALLRPYGGVACLPGTDNDTWLRREASGLAGARIRHTDDWLLLSREGPLPGAADWTHQNADAANTRVSRDRIVRAPLGLLWFGGPSHAGTLPRHGHGPQPQVIDGRAIVEGVDMFRALDIYTGRLLWETRLSGVGAEYDNTHHQAGANGSGSNFATVSDGVYIAHGTRCLRLDPATGKQMAEFRLRGVDGAWLDWNYVALSGNTLVALASPLDPEPGDRAAPASSKVLAVLDRHSGQVLWRRTAQAGGYRHNAVCVGKGRLYAIDRPRTDTFARRPGEDDSTPARLVAADLRSGKEIWSTSKEVFGTWLSFSERHDALVEAGRISRDSLYDEPRGMRVYRGGNGAVLWHRDDYSGPAMLRGGMILKDKGACDLLTGAPVLRRDPFTGDESEWSWTRGYGCNTPAASEHLLTFRSGCAGFFDLTNDGGTGNLGGFRSGCTNNLVVAGGVLVAPEYTRTCTCGYPNQTSVALVPMPEAEMWTMYGKREVTGLVRKAAINLGAPGSRKADDGTLWIDYPPSAPNPRPTIVSVPETPETWRRHVSQVEKSPARKPTPAWVASSGVRGLAQLSVTLGPADGVERRYTVRLHFVDPDAKAAGQRSFNVALQGRTVLSDFAVAAAAGGVNRAVIREFKGIAVTRDLTLTLTPADCAGACEPVLSGLEIELEEPALVTK